MASVVVNGTFNTLSSRQYLAGAGNYWQITNPTPGTAIAYANQTSFSATANGMFSIRNTQSAGANSKSIYLDRLKLIQTATAPTGTLVMRFEVFIETGAVAMTTAVATRTPINCNPASTTLPSTIAVVQSFAAGAATVPAAATGATRTLVDVGSLQCGVQVTHDEYVIDFGADGPATGTAGLTAARATAPARISTQMAPVVIAPNCTAWLNGWVVTGAANVPSFEFALGWTEQ